MKKMYLFALALFMSVITFGQTTETEPNNSFATANASSYGQNVSASLGGGDVIDYFKATIPGYGYEVGAYLIRVTVTNTGTTGAHFNFKLYNLSEVLVHDENASETEIPAGTTVSKDFVVCGQKLEDVYLVFSSTGSFDYQFSTSKYNRTTDQEPNNIRSQATIFTNSETVSAGIQYTLTTGGTQRDETDWFKIQLEEADYNLLTLMIEARNFSCADGQWINYECFKNDSQTPFVSGYVGGDNSVRNNYSVKSNLSLSDLQEGDFLTIKFTASAPFNYNVKVNFAGSSADGGDYQDQEPNEEYTDAIFMPENTEMFGNVGESEYDEEDESYYSFDPYDTYKIVLSEPGDLTFYLTAKPQIENLDELTVYYDVLNADGYEISYQNQLLFVNYPSPYGPAYANAVKHKEWAAGTYYIKLYSNTNNEDNAAWINYGLFYQLASTQSESPDAEPNDEIYQAVRTQSGTTFNGNVGKGEDHYDSYQFIMPYAGAANFTFQATNDECGKKSYLNYSIYDKNGNTVYYGQPIFSWTEGDPCGTLKTGNIKLRGLESDTFYIKLFAFEVGVAGRGTAPETVPITYNFSYQFVDQADNDAEPNNTIQNAIPVAPGEIKKGRVNFYHSENASKDYMDYYALNMPTAGNVDLIIKTIYRSDKILENQSDPLLSIQGLNTSFLDAKIPGYPRVQNVNPDSSYIDTIHICGAGSGPLLIKIQGKSSEYEFHFEVKDEVTDITEIEPNGFYSPGQVVRDSTLIKGTINYFENGDFDNQDKFKIPVYGNSPITLYVKAVNMQCEVRAASAWLKFTGKKQAGGNIFERYIADNYQVVPGETIYDTIQINLTGPDTLFLSVSSSIHTNFKYEFVTNTFKPTSLFTIKGDTTVCLGAQQYIAANIDQQNLTYHWSLPEGGGTITWVDSVASVTWNQAGIFPIQLYLENTAGTSTTKTTDIIVNDAPPPVAPDIFNFARNLSTSALPPGFSVQWYRNGTPVEDATDSVYYAALAGNYTARFINDCGSGPVSNPYSFPADAKMQNLTFAHHSDISMSPELRIKLAGSASSGLPVFYSVISGPGTISNDSLRINGVGVIIIKAEQPGDDEFSAAGEKYDTITVLKGSQVITVQSIPDQLYRNGSVYPGATSSSGLPVIYKIISGQASGGNFVKLLGAGSITIQAEQAGDANYNAATPVQQTFCVGVDTLSAIKGAEAACLGTYTYTVQKIPGANYAWTLSGGGTIVTHNDTAFVTWTTAGTFSLKVKANSDCYPAYSFEPNISITVAHVVPTPVMNMLPADGAMDQGLPLALSWLPGQYTETYDLYVWDSTSERPSIPYRKDLTAISFTIPQDAFPYNAAYKWQIISKNPCNQTSSVVQSFRLIPLPDLKVTQVLAPTTAISGQTVSISWTVKNDGPGASLATQKWQDNVYLSFDSLPNLLISPKVGNGGDWNQTDLPVRPLLIASKNNVAALQPGEQYSNTINFTLPVNYNFPLYVFVQTNRNKTILEQAYDNNVDSAINPIAITLAPAPDLRVDSIFAPNTVFSGAYITIPYKVKNYGTLTPPDAKWVDRIYMSQSPLFDSASAIKLKTMGFGERYYPDVPEARAIVSTQLQQDSVYSFAIEAVIPNFIFGKWFIHVRTNDDHRLYEGLSFSNNVNTSEIQVYLTPTPHLTVNSVTLPVSEASTTQSIGINWVIKNTGFTDNIEKNQGHYYSRRDGWCLKICDRNQYSDGEIHYCVDYTKPKYADSLGFGSSYWLDRVYLSSDPAGLDINNATLLYEYKNGIKPFAGVDYYQNTALYACDKPVVVNGDHALLPNRTFANGAGFTVPQDLAPGTYYVYVYTNPTKTVFEYPGSPEIKRSGPIVIERPDVVAAINAPANAVAGTPVEIEYAISNNGPGGVYNHKRVDQLYMSTNAVFDGSATLVATKTYTENVLAGTPVTHNFSYKLHPSQSGNRYFFVKTNTTYSFAETDSTNNMSAPAVINFAPAAPVDFVVSQISSPDTILAGNGNAYLQYTITNNGLGKGTGLATDSFFISCSPTYSSATAFYLGKMSKKRDIAPGASVTDTFTTALPLTVEINDCFTKDIYNDAYFFVKTNATDSIYEGGNQANNVSGTSQKVIKNLFADLSVHHITGAATASVGRPYVLTWQVENVGEPTGKFFHVLDSVYLSADSVFNVNDVIPFTSLSWEKNIMGRIVLNQGVNRYFINVSPGDYYVFIKTNTAKQPWLPEINFNNNINLMRDANGKASTISVSRPPLPDLMDSIISYPTKSSPGQPMTVIHRIANIGEGASYPDKFRLNMWLSDDAQGNTVTYSLHSKEKSVIIPAGGFVDDTIKVYLPHNTIAKNYTLVTSLDDNQQVIETDETNNRSVVFTNIFIPEPVDLVITSVQAVDTVMLGYNIDSVRYIVNNHSANPAVGYTSDGFYLSGSGVLDSAAVLIAVKEKNIDLKPLKSDTLAFAPFVSGVTEGLYTLIVNTDLTNTIPETNETNNTAMVATPVYVKVKELELNTLEQSTLGYPRYYKLIIPDSLYGATISVKLVSEDSLSAVNQMFIGKGYIPDASHFDYTYPTANYGNQDVVMAYTTPGTYYISLRRIRATGSQNITLKARKLPFEISNIQSATGGNIGNVTIKISGSLFTEGMTARLNRSGTEITASKIYFTNTTLVYATFNLKDKPLGIYDLTLSKGDTSFAVLNNGFSVVKADNGGLITGSGPNTGAGDGGEPGCDPGAASGLNSQLVTDLVVPDKIFAGWPFAIQIHFKNPTNYDIPAQVRTLYSEDIVKLGFTPESTTSGPHILTIEMSETDGPPGVIRAGGSGTIIMYGRSNDDVRGHTFSVVNLK